MRGFVPGLVHTTEQLGHRPCIGRSLAFHLRIEPVLIGSDLLFGQMLSQHGGYELDRFVVDFIGLSYGENNRSRRHRGEQLVDNIRGHVSGAVLGRITPERGPEGFKDGGKITEEVLNEQNPGQWWQLSLRSEEHTSEINS